MDIGMFATLLFFGLGMLGLRAIFDNSVSGIAGLLFMLIGAYTIQDGVTKAIVVNNTVSYVQATGHSEIIGLFFIVLGALFLINAAVGGEE